MTTSVNKPLTQAEQIFKQLVWDPLLKAGEGALEAAVPALALPVIKQLDESILGIVADQLYSLIVQFVDVTTIKLLNAEHQAAYEKASIQLKVISLDSGGNSDAYIQARNAALDALSAFTRFNE